MHRPKTVDSMGSLLCTYILLNYSARPGKPSTCSQSPRRRGGGDPVSREGDSASGHSQRMSTLDAHLWYR